MKTTLVILLAAFAFPAVAQQIRVNAYAGYVFDDNVDSYYDPTNYYNGKIKGGFEWGGGLEFMARPNYGVEIVYLRLDTKAPISYYQDGAQRHTTFDLGANYIMLGANRYFSRPGSKVEAFTGLQLGMNIMDLKNPDNGKSTNKTFFAWGLKGGVNIWMTDNVGLKLQVNLISSVQSVGGGFYFGTGGASAGLTSYSSMYQFGLGGGLVFKINSAAKK